MDLKIPDENLKPKKTNRIDHTSNPIKFALWLFMAIIAIIYISLTATFLSREISGISQNALLPEIFLINTYLLLLSMVTGYWAYFSAKRNNLNELKAALLLTIFLGLSFINQQKKGWVELLMADNIFTGTKTNSTSAFFLIISSLHAIHLLAGLIFFFATLFNTFQHKVHSKNMLQMELSFSFWSFAVIIWLCFLILFI
jgi:cytochrome c oxidase subunit III